MKKILIAALITMSIALTGCSGEKISNNGSKLDIGSESNVESKLEETRLEKKNNNLFEYESDIKTSKSNEGEVVLSYAVSYPQFKNKNNKESLNKINDGIKEYVDSFNSSMESSFSYLFDDDFETDQIPQGGLLQMTVKRCDEKIISVEVMKSIFSGGAHSNQDYEGMTFDAETGERLSFYDLSDLTDIMEDAIYYETFNRMKTLISMPGYSDIIGDISDDDLNQSLYGQDYKWYLSNSGIVFMSNPYELGAYAYGSIRFNIPYSGLSTLDSKYDYDGNYFNYARLDYDIIEDLNGDEVPERILMKHTYSADDGKEKGDLIISDVSYSNELKNLDKDEVYKDGYYVVDLDESDNYKEIAIETKRLGEYSSFTDEKSLNKFEGKTYFYRYSNDSKLEYIGCTDELVSDIRVDYKKCKIKK